METNMESMFDHVNSKASLSKHFVRDEEEKYTNFWKFQTEACLYWSRENLTGARERPSHLANFCPFYLLEKEVIESNYEVAKKLFVEIFNSREAYIEFVMIGRASVM